LFDVAVAKVSVAKDHIDIRVTQQLRDEGIGTRFTTERLI